MSFRSFKRLCLLFCVSAISQSALAADIKLSCPVALDEPMGHFTVGMLPGHLDITSYGIKARDWQAKNFDQVLQKLKECLEQDPQQALFRQSIMEDTTAKFAQYKKALPSRDEAIKEEAAMTARARERQQDELDLQKKKETTQSSASSEVTQTATPNKPSERTSNQSDEVLCRDTPQLARCTPENFKPETPIDYRPWMALVLGLLLNVVYAVSKHQTNQLTLYWDYTDAAFTSAAPLVILLTYFALLAAKADTQSIHIFIWAESLFFGWYIFKSSFAHNQGLKNRLVSIAAKLTLSLGYYVAMLVLIGLMISHRTTRKKGEWQSTVDAKNTAALVAYLAAMSATTAGFVKLTTWLTRYPSFGTLSEYFKPQTAIDRVTRAQAQVVKQEAF
jgi:hypothetical protein